MIKRALWLVPFLIAGCGESENEDIKKWMAETSKDMRGKVEKIDEPKKFEAFKYESDMLVDPFNATNVYWVALDSAYTGQITVPTNASGASNAITKHVGVWTIPTVGKTNVLINSWD